MDQIKTGDQKKSKQPGIIFGLFIFLIGIAILGWGYNSWKLTQASKDWPVTEGRIVKSEVEKEWSGSGSRSHWTYEAVIVYEYSLKGKDYASGKVTGADYSGPRSHAYALVEQYPKGKTVSVYYDPDDPQTAVLEPGSPGGLFIPFITGSVFFLAGISVIRSNLTGKGRITVRSKVEPRPFPGSPEV